MSETSYNVKEPGLNVLPPGVERYVVAGGGINVLQILPEDKIEIINDEGKQICEIIVFNSKGKNDLSILNLKENSNANFSKKVAAIYTKNKDQSIFGVWGMNGNVSEWTSSWYQPYQHSTHMDENYGKKFKVTRGGSYFKRDHGFTKEFVMIPFRNILPLNARFWDTGFRCALSK